MGLISMLEEFNYGKARYRVILYDIQCRKNEFSSYCSGEVIDEIEKYGSAIKIAKAFREKDWFLTERNILVCGDAPKLGTLYVSISVDKNLDFLVSQNKERIKGGYAVEVLIDGLDASKEETVAREGALRDIIFGPLK